MRGDRLRALRKKYGYSRQKLAELLGIGESQIPRYETNQNKPSSDVVVRIAQLFDVSTDYLLGLTDDPHSHWSSELSDTEVRLIHALRHRGAFEAVKVITNEGRPRDE